MDINNDLFVGIKSWLEDGTDTLQLFHARTNQVYGELAVDSPRMPKRVIVYQTVGDLNHALEIFCMPN